MSIPAFTSPWTEVAAAFRARPTLAFLPFGALEQHGPHLPLGTDTVTATHVAEAVCTRVNGVLLPPVHYGDTWNNAGYPGTVSLRPETVSAIAEDIGRSVHAAHAAGLVIINGDWGNRQPLYTATRRLLDAGIAAITLDYPGMDDAIAAVTESAAAAPGLHHADEVETSIMLALRPETVRTGSAVACYPAFPAEFGIQPMQLHSFSDSGVFGDPQTATAQKGRAILDATIEASVAIVEAFQSRLTGERS